MISYLLKFNGYSKNQKLIFLVFIIISILNFGNYSWLNYSVDGIPTSIPILNFIRDARIFFPFFIFLFFSINKAWRIKIRKSIQNNLMEYLLVFVFFYGTLLSSNPLNSLVYTLWLFFSLIVIHLTVREALNSTHVIKLLKYGSVVTLILSILSLPNLLVNSEFSLFSSKTYYAYPVLIYILCELYLLIFEKKSFFYYFRYLIIALSFAIIFLSGRRTALICAIFGLIFFLYKKNRYFSIIIFSLILFLFPVLVQYNILGFEVQESLTFKRILRIFEAESFADTSYSAREVLWNQYLSAFKNSPIIGTGYNTSDYNISSIQAITKDYMSYHNSFLQVLVESGILGSLFLLISIIKSTFKTFRKSLFLLPFLFAFFVVNWFETNFLPGQVFFIYSFTILCLTKNEKSNINI